MRAFVVGGTGLIGSTIIRRLVEQGTSVRATTRNPDAAPRPPNVEWLKIAADRPEVPPRALAHGDRVFLLAPTGWTDQFAFLAPWINAAATAEVNQLVLMTAHEPDNDDRAPFHRAEAALRATSIPGAILRPSWFMQNFHTYWGDEIRRAGLIAVPAGHGRVGFIDTRDIADVAATLLLEAPRPCQTLVLTGPEALGHAEVARLLSQATRRDVRYRCTDAPSFQRSLIDSGMSAAYADLVVAMFSTVRAGRAAAVTNAVQAVTGRPARHFADYAGDYRDLLI